MLSEFTCEFTCDEFGGCVSCGWREEFPNSHIEHCGGFGCDYINKKYDVSYDRNGELKWELKKAKIVFGGTKIIKKKVVKKKVVKKENPLKKINPLALMKRLPTDINIRINEFLIDEKGLNTDLMKVFLRNVYFEEEFYHKMNKIYNQEINKEEMNEYEYAIRNELVENPLFENNDFIYASNITSIEYETDDGRPFGSIKITLVNKKRRNFEIIDADYLNEKFESEDYIRFYQLLDGISAHIIYEYVFNNLMSYQKSLCPSIIQIMALQKESVSVHRHIDNMERIGEDGGVNLFYNTLKNYVYMVGDNIQFYNWFVEYYFEEAIKFFCEIHGEKWYSDIYLEDGRKFWLKEL